MDNSLYEINKARQAAKILACYGVEINKSTENDIEKGKSFPIGTIHDGYKKIKDGVWRKVPKEGREKDEKDYSDDHVVGEYNLESVKKVAKEKLNGSNMPAATIWETKGKNGSTYNFNFDKKEMGYVRDDGGVKSKVVGIIENEGKANKDKVKIDKIVDSTNAKLENWYKNAKEDYGVDGHGKARYDKDSDSIVIDFVENGKKFSHEEKHWRDEGIDYTYNVWMESEREDNDNSTKSPEASKVLQLMDKDMSYGSALKQVLSENKDLDKDTLEKELDKYI